MWHSGAGPSGGGTGSAGGAARRRDEELEETGREMSAATGSRESDSAGLWRSLGTWVGVLGRGRRQTRPADGQGPRFGRWTHGAKIQSLGPSEAGTLELKFRGDVILTGVVRAGGRLCGTPEPGA